MSVTQFEQLELHDMPVTGLHLDFVSECLVISLKRYDEEIEDYRPVELLFQQVSNFESTPLLLSLMRDDQVEWYSSKVQQDGNAYIARIVFLTGHSQPSITLGFRFGQIVIAC